MITELLPERRTLDNGTDLEEFYRLPPVAHLRLNFIASLDGAVEVGGRSAPLGGPADRAVFMALRAVADAILVGAGTARAENYGPGRLSEEVRRRRKDRDQHDRPLLAVVSARGDLDPGARLFSGADPERVLVLTTDAVVEGRPDLSEVAELISCGRSAVDMARVLDALRERGLARILCEGGPALARTLLELDLVDELCLTLAPLLAGTGQSLVGVGDPLLDRRFLLRGLLESESMLLARYQIRSGS